MAEIVQPTPRFVLQRALPYLHAYLAFGSSICTVPISERVSAYGKLGLAHSKREWKNNIGYSAAENDNDVYAGGRVVGRVEGRLLIARQEKPR
jgi:hypothetical protein